MMKNSLFLEGYWAIDGKILQEIGTEVGKLSVGFDSNLQTKKDNYSQVTNRIAVIDVIGPIFQYENLYTAFFGGVAIETLVEQLTIVDNSNIDGVVLRIDSPGGTAVGFTELTDFISDIASRKPVVAWANMCCSGALLLAAATRKIYTTPMSILGSVGVIYSQYKADDSELSIVSSNAPLKNASLDDDAGKKNILGLIDDLETTFVNKLSSYRQITVSQILETWGRGGVMSGNQALAVGMADELLSYRSTLGVMVTMQEHTDDSVAAETSVETKVDIDAQVQVQAQALVAKQVAQEKDRQSGLKSFFEIFSNEANHKEAYQTLLIECLTDTAISVTTAQERVKVLRSTFTKDDELASPVTGGAGGEFTTTEPPKTFESMVSQYERDYKISKGEATTRVVAEYPELHVTYINRVNEGIPIKWEPDEQRR